MRTYHVNSSENYLSRCIHSGRNGWNGKANGELLAAMLEKFPSLAHCGQEPATSAKFSDLSDSCYCTEYKFITFDDLQPLMSKVNELLEGELPDGSTIVNE